MYVTEGELVRTYIFGEYNKEKKHCTDWFGYVKSVKFNEISIGRLCNFSTGLGKRLSVFTSTSLTNMCL